MASLNDLSNVSKRTRGIEGIKEKFNVKGVAPTTKRAAETSPGKDSKKRPILGDVTNQTNDMKIQSKTCNVFQPITKEYNKKSENDIKLKIQPSVVLYRPEANIKSIPEINPIENASSSTTADNKSEPLPPGVNDFDEEMKNDIFSESGYAKDIFEYYKGRELKFTIEKYMDRQSDMSKSMRAILVDWMVEVQESFELNHETLYLAVKLVDMYLMKHSVPKIMIQLVGATAALIASKYDERIPPLVDDFLYICDDTYSRDELIAMECEMLKTVDFDLGIPISYRFLRRYARCSKTSMETLTLARFILETSLMEYDFIDVRDSMMASAALLLANKMKNTGEWTPTLQYYSGYKEEELWDLVKQLNTIISPPINKLTMTIRTKYSHSIFFEVAKIQPLQID